MTLKQLTFLREVARQSLNMSKAAVVLYTSQPGISRQIQMLERELGVELLFRRRNKTLGFTEIGKLILEASQRMLTEVENIKVMAEDARNDQRGKLKIVTTHLHARHTLLEPITSFIRSHPNVTLQLVAVIDPDNMAKLLEENEADLGISTELTFTRTGVTVLQGPALKRSLILPKNHPLEKKKRISILDITRYPLLGFDSHSRSSQVVVDILQSSGIEPEPKFLARVMDTDVIKAYVAKGLGVAVIPSIAYEAEVDTELRCREVTHLFPKTYVAVTFRKGAHLRKYVLNFIELVLPSFNRQFLKTKPGIDASAPGG